jgi:hypothetical protein
VQQILGGMGVKLLNTLLALDPVMRPSAVQAERHLFFHPCLMFRNVAPQDDRFGQLGFEPAMRPDVFPGIRHDYQILRGHLAPEVLNWLRQDFTPEAVRQLSINPRDDEGRPNVKVEANRKWILGGKLGHVVGSGTMCKLHIDKELPLPNFCAFWAAFRRANSATILSMHQHARKLSQNFDVDTGDENRQHFLEMTSESWFGTAAELAVSYAQGSWREPIHLDGGASILHAGVTIFGHRDLKLYIPGSHPPEAKEFCKTIAKARESEGHPAKRQKTELPGKVEPPFLLANEPGTCYLGTLTGPLHGVDHTESAPEDLLPDGRKAGTGKASRGGGPGGLSVSVMIRTTLFPHNQARQKETTPCPTKWFFAMQALLGDCLKKYQWRLPSLAECQAEKES